MIYRYHFTCAHEAIEVVSGSGDSDAWKKVVIELPSKLADIVSCMSGQSCLLVSSRQIFQEAVLLHKSALDQQVKHLELARIIAKMMGRYGRFEIDLKNAMLGAMDPIDETKALISRELLIWAKIESTIINNGTYVQHTLSGTY